jgi:hypothetical protein
VKHIGTSGRDFYVDDVRRSCGWLSAVRHLCEVGTDLSGAEFQATALVDVRDLGLGDTGGEIGGHSSLVVVLRHNLDGLNGEWLRGVLREHSDHHFVHNLELCTVESCDFNEDIGSVETDFGVVTVDDGRQRANGLL